MTPLFKLARTLEDQAAKTRSAVNQLKYRKPTKFMHQILLSEQLYGLQPVKHLRLLNRLPTTDQDNG